MVAEGQAREAGALAEVDRPRAGMALSFAEMRIRVQQLDEFYRGVMQKGTDYDVIPGTPKPTLLQPGAQMLDAVFGLAPIFEEIEGTVRDYEGGFFAYEIRCKLLSKATGETVAEGLGSCNNKEGRYRWRDAKPTCPECGYELRVSRNAPEWYCWRQKGGCGATYPLDQIEAGGKVENDDPYTLANTILKMAQKRAHVAATLNATGASRIFTQDVEDMGPLVGTVTAATSEPAPRANGQPEQEQPPEIDRLTCEECGETLTETRFKDGKVWSAAQLAVYGRRKHSKILDMKCYREANQRKAEEVAF